MEITEGLEFKTIYNTMYHISNIRKMKLLEDQEIADIYNSDGLLVTTWIVDNIKTLLNENINDTKI